MCERELPLCRTIAANTTDISHLRRQRCASRQSFCFYCGSPRSSWPGGYSLSQRNRACRVIWSLAGVEVVCGDLKGSLLCSPTPVNLPLLRTLHLNHPVKLWFMLPARFFTPAYITAVYGEELRMP